MALPQAARPRSRGACSPAPSPGPGEPSGRSCGGQQFPSGRPGRGWSVVWSVRWRRAGEGEARAKVCARWIFALRGHCRALSVAHSGGWFAAARWCENTFKANLELTRNVCTASSDARDVATAGALRRAAMACDALLTLLTRCCTCPLLHLLLKPPAAFPTALFIQLILRVKQHSRSCAVQFRCPA